MEQNSRLNLHGLGSEEAIQGRWASCSLGPHFARASRVRGHSSAGGAATVPREAGDEKIKGQDLPDGRQKLQYRA